jgi:RimJ/RimL family protein N-acetyltransferase
VLADGTRLHVRRLTPDDEPLLHDAFSRMSERSVYFRFFSPLKRLSDDLAHRLAATDGQQRFALCATTHRLSPGHREQIVGVARYDRVPGTDVAEVAVAVVDDFQRRGLGAQLLSMLVAVAREHGIRTFTLIVLPENQSMLRLLRRLGWIHQAKLVGGMYEITFDL